MNKLVNSPTRSLVSISLMTSLLVGLSFSVNANELQSTDIVKSLERNIAAQMREAVQVAQQELRLSVQAQLSESLFEMQDSVAIANRKATKKKFVITSAAVK